MSAKLLTYTPDPEQTVAAAARLCYSAATIDSLVERAALLALLLLSPPVDR